ncbi:MAG TPA: hypothetical protein VK789_33560 [Bryobacteraceae bacterium]|jgi:hypothetical protein|nr:hypothetical protein [Bryobacteraceae bacterium]
MTPATAEQTVINEARWQEWMEKGKRHERAAARKFKIAAAIVLPLFAIGVAFYLLSIK